MGDLTYAEVARVIRSRLRRYSLISIVNVGLNHLTQQHESYEKAVLAMPWLAALVLKLALEDKMIHPKLGATCSKAEFEDCCNAIWNADHVHDGSIQILLLGVRATLHAQLIFQKPETFGFLRWAALISRLDEEHACQKLFQRVFSLSPDEYMLAAMLLMSRFRKDVSKQPLDLRTYSNISQNLIGPLHLLVNLFARDLSGLRAQLQIELHARLVADQPARPESERHEFPWLAKFPILRLDAHRVLAWNPTIFFHGLEEFVHIRLSEYGQAYTDNFSRVFEDYVIELIVESGTQAITDREFKNLGNPSMSAVDALIPSAEGNVFIESKMSLFTDDVLLSDRPRLVKSKLRRIREAIVQGWKVGDLLRSNEVDLKEASLANRDYLIIVTSRQLLFGNGAHLTDMVDERFFDQILKESGFLSPSEAQLDRMPPQNITILSIEEFEHLIGAVKSGRTTYLSFAQQAAKDASDPATMKMIADQQIKEYVDRWYVPDLIVTAKNRLLARMTEELAPTS